MGNAVLDRLHALGVVPIDEITMLCDPEWTALYVHDEPTGTGLWISVPGMAGGAPEIRAFQKTPRWLLVQQIAQRHPGWTIEQDALGLPWSEEIPHDADGATPSD
jgi:hypothetical protein